MQSDDMRQVKFSCTDVLKEERRKWRWPRTHLGCCGVFRERKTKSELEADTAAETPKLRKEFIEYRQISLALAAINGFLCT